MKSQSNACRTRNLHRLRSVSPAYVAVVEDLGEWEDDMDRLSDRETIEEQSDILLGILSCLQNMAQNAANPPIYPRNQTGMH